MPRLDRVLILGGTAEGRALAGACADLPGLAPISSLAGRTSAPLLPHGPVRIGGFGGVPGLVDYLRAERIAAIVDATHPFAARMTANAVEAARLTGLPLLVLRRPGWIEGPGDDWHRAGSIEAAAELVPKLGERVFLTTGRQTIGAFAGLDACWFLARSVEPPDPPTPERIEVLLDRGPFTLDGERALFTSRQIDVLVTKDSGGIAPKLAAARELGRPVLVVDRPPIPAAVETVPTVEAATEWLSALQRGG